MMKKLIFLLFALTVGSLCVQAQTKIEIRGKVFESGHGKPLAGASVLADNLNKSVITDEAGEFVLTAESQPHRLTVKAIGFHETQVVLRGRTSVEIYLLPLTLKGYPGVVPLPLKRIPSAEKVGISSVVSTEDMERSHIFVDELLAGSLPGVRALQKSGMPGEGYFVSVRGTRSLIGRNTPLIVMDGMPILTDQTLSPVFSGYSRNLLNSVSIKELSDISVVKGFDASAFGAASSNGVLMVNTEHAADMDTRVEFETVNGVGFVPRTLPLLSGDEYRSYFSRIGQTRYSGDELLTAYPFLKENSKEYAYHNNTDWQKQIFSPAFTTENLLKVKGGDAVAKYALMAGYLNNSGIIDNSGLSRYSVRFNGDMVMSRRLTMFANMSFNYLQTKIYEQGMVAEINPLLTALRKPAIENPFRKDIHGNDLNAWAEPGLVQVSNPSVVADQVFGKSNQYETMVNLGVNYTILNGLSIKAMGGLHYNYSTENFFIPGISTPSIVPMEGGKAKNTVRNGIGKNMTYYGNIALNYDREIRPGHELNVVGGTQFIWLDRLYEYAKGLNTATDYNQSISSAKDAFARSLGGYDESWRWSNFYANATYALHKQLYLGASLSADASSVKGEAAQLFNFYPAANVAWRMKESPWLRSRSWINDLTLRFEASAKGNAMMPPMLAAYTYEGVNFQTIGGIMRANIPNNMLSHEYVMGLNGGIDFALRGRKLAVSFDWFQDETRDMVVPQSLSDAFGSKLRYVNDGRMLNRGFEVSASAVVLSTGNFEWLMGATVSRSRAELKSLGGAKESIMTLGDGGEIITRVGESPYLFYGLESLGVFSGSPDADAAGLRDHIGRAYEAGDMHFRDLNADGVINQDDKTVIGDPNPDFYGGFYLSLRYKTWTLSGRFTYSYGNDVYNAVRRKGESMTDFSGQTKAVLGAWRYEGQQADLPRAEWGDPMNNSRFSSRWIEDGSYLKLKNLTLAYDYPDPVLIFRKLQAYVSVENLFTWTGYLGYDPEFAYSYDHNMLGVDYGKVPGAMTFKLGLRLGF